MTRAWPVRTLELVSAAALYFLAARLGLALASPAPQVSLVWPPTAIALVLLRNRGPHLWPAVFAGALGANLLADEPLGAALLIASGNTAAGLSARWLLERFEFRGGLARLRDVLLLALWGAAVPAALSATVGTASLCLSGVQPWQAAPALWAAWWLGDAMGVLLLAPFLLVWAGAPAVLPSARTALEGVCVLAAVALAARIAFSGDLRALVPEPGLGFILFPFAIWAALRLGPRGASAAVLVAAAVTLGTTVLEDASPRELALLQVFLAGLAGSTLLLAAALAERRAAEGRLTALHATARAMADAGTRPGDPTIFGAISTSLVWECGALWAVGPDETHLECLEVWRRLGGEDAFTEQTRGIRFSRGIGLPGRVWSTGAAAWVLDVTRDANFPRAAAASAGGLRTGFAVPVSVDGRVIGVLEFFSRARARPDRTLLETMTFVGTQVGRVLERRKAAEAVRRSEALKAAMLEAALDCVIGMDHEGRVTEFNPAAERTFGWSRAEVLGRSLAETIVPPSLREAHQAGLSRYLREERPILLGRRVEMSALRRDGTEFSAELTVVRIPTDGLPRFTGYLRDISDRKRAERDLLAANAELRRSNEELDRFASVASHDLQEPLRTITSYAQLLERHHATALDGEAREILAYLTGSAARMSVLISGLLAYSRAGHAGQRASVSPTEAAREALANLAGAVAESGARVSLPELPRVLADRRELVQIFQNVVGNAIKFAGGRTPEIAVAGSQNEGLVHLRVSDNGIGIPPEFLDKAFLLFQRYHSAQEYPGTGLGLAICKKIVEGHGGRIWAESAVGRGSTVHFTLPAASPGAEP